MFTALNSIYITITHTKIYCYPNQKIKMRIAVVFVIALLPLLGFGNPIAEAASGEIMARKTCTTNRATHCWAGAGKDYRIIWDLFKGRSLPVKCKANGNLVGNSK